MIEINNDHRDSLHAKIKIDNLLLLEESIIFIPYEVSCKISIACARILYLGSISL